MWLSQLKLANTVIFVLLILVWTFLTKQEENPSLISHCSILVSTGVRLQSCICAGYR